MGVLLHLWTWSDDPSLACAQPVVPIAGSMHAFFNDFLPHCQREIFRLEFVGYVRAFELLSWHHGRSCGDSSSLGGPHEMGVRRDHLDSPVVVICDFF